MSAERVVSGLASGLLASWVGGAIDVKKIKEGSLGMADAAVSTAAICTVCTFASEYLNMPFLVPIILSGLARASHESVEFSRKVIEKIEGIKNR